MVSKPEGHLQEMILDCWLILLLRSIMASSGTNITQMSICNALMTMNLLRDLVLSWSSRRIICLPEKICPGLIWEMFLPLILLWGLNLSRFIISHKIKIRSWSMSNIQAWFQSINVQTLQHGSMGPIFQNMKLQIKVSKTLSTYAQLWWEATEARSGSMIQLVMQLLWLEHLSLYFWVLQPQVKREVTGETWSYIFCYTSFSFRLFIKYHNAFNVSTCAKHILSYLLFAEQKIIDTI